MTLAYLTPALFEGEPFPVLTVLDGGQSVDGPGSPDNRLRRHNKRLLEGWMRFYNTRFPSAGRKGMMNLEELEKPGPSWGPLERGENWNRLNDHGLYLSDVILNRLIFGIADLGLPPDHPANKIKPLRRSHPHNFERMCGCFFDIEADDAALDGWRARAHDDLGAKMQRDLVEDGIERVLDKLDEIGHTLVVRVEERARSDREAEQKRKRAERRELYWHKRGDDVPPGQAVKEVARETRCAPSSVYDAIGKVKEEADAPTATTPAPVQAQPEGGLDLRAGPGPVPPGGREGT